MEVRSEHLLRNTIETALSCFAYKRHRGQPFKETAALLRCVCGGRSADCVHCRDWFDWRASFEEYDFKREIISFSGLTKWIIARSLIRCK